MPIPQKQDEIWQRECTCPCHTSGGTCDMCASMKGEAGKETIVITGVIHWRKEGI
jgi:hypothetical protein